MRINEIISESQQSLRGNGEPLPIDGDGKVKSYDKLNSFRTAHRGLNIPAIGDDSQEIDLNVKTRDSRSDSNIHLPVTLLLV